LTKGFIKEVIPREMEGSSDLFLGMGFVGANGMVTKGFGIDFLFFLLMAKKVGEKISNGKRIIFVMDKPYQKIVIPNIEEKIILIEETINFLGMNEWEIIKSSSLSFSEKTNYEEFQSNIIAKNLCKGGFQVGWVYPGKSTPGRKDERYFAEQFRKYFPKREDVGFILGEFPGIIPRYKPGPPYLIQDLRYKILMVDPKDDILLKLEGRRINGKTAQKLFYGFECGGLLIEKNLSVKERFVACMGIIEENLGDCYKKAFPNSSEAGNQ